MVTRDRRRSTGATGMLAAVGAGAVIGLAACGSAATGGAGTPATPAAPHLSAAAAHASAGVPLCTHVAQLSQMIVSRTQALGNTHFRELLPRGITVRDPAKVRALARALCALPPVPGGSAVAACPADFGGVFRLSFISPGRGYPRVTVHPTGCRGVTGLGAPRTWATSPGFAAVLNQTLTAGPGVIPGKHGSVPTS